MFTTMYELIKKYGRDKNYIFFRVSEHRQYGRDKSYTFFRVSEHKYSTQVSILAHYTNGKFYDYSYYEESHPINLVSAMGISGIEVEFYRSLEVEGDDIDVLVNNDVRSIIDYIVDASFKQDETNDGRTVKFECGTYAMLGSVKEEYYDVTVTRTGFARVKACSYEDACEAAAKLKEEDVSWSDSWEFDCYVNDERNEI